MDARFGALAPDARRAADAALTATVTSYPTPVAFRLVVLRAVKDKLPRGRYVVTVTVFNRLGGVPYMWSRLHLGGAGPGMPGTHLSVFGAH